MSVAGENGKKIPGKKPEVFETGVRFLNVLPGCSKTLLVTASKLGASH